MTLVVGGAVGVDRIIADQLFKQPSDFVPAYRAFDEYTAGVKLNQLESERGRFNAFFLGNSRTLAGVNPAIVDRRTSTRGARLKSYNLAMPKMDVRFWPQFFRRYYAGHRPHYLFLGLVPDDMDPRTEVLQPITSFFQSAGFSNRHMSGISRWAEEKLAHLFLLRGRIDDTRLISLSDVVHGRMLKLLQIHVSNQGWWEWLPELGEPKSLLQAQWKTARQHGETVAFNLGAGQVRSLIELNGWVRAGGGCLILFTTPQLYDRYMFIRSGFTTAMRRIENEAPTIQFVDVGGDIQSTMGFADFGDSDHVTPQGAFRLSSALAPVLQSAMKAPACTRSSGA
jgi:hypothetical protein